MVFHSAKVLEKADDGVDIYKVLFRILTPLIKFRSCRDARKSYWRSYGSEGWMWLY